MNDPFSMNELMKMKNYCDKLYKIPRRKKIKKILLQYKTLFFTCLPEK